MVYTAQRDWNTDLRVGEHEREDAIQFASGSSANEAMEPDVLVHVRNA